VTITLNASKGQVSRVIEMFMPRRISSAQVRSSSRPIAAPSTSPAVGPAKPRPTSRIWFSCTPAVMTRSEGALAKTQVRC
jgi:hypothetical protein